MMYIVLQGKVQSATLSQLIGKGTTSEQNYNDWAACCQFLRETQARRLALPQQWRQLVLTHCHRTGGGLKRAGYVLLYGKIIGHAATLSEPGHRRKQRLSLIAAGQSHRLANHHNQ